MTEVANTTKLYHVGFIMVDEYGGVDFLPYGETTSEADTKELERRGYRKTFTIEPDTLGWHNMVEDLTK